MKVALILADFAQESGGKLTIVGAGWNRISAGSRPVSLAIFIDAEDFEGAEHDLMVRLLKEDGEPVLNNEGKPLGAIGKFASARVEGSKVPVALLPLALTFQGIDFEPGLFRFEVVIDDGTATDVQWFEVIGD